MLRTPSEEDAKLLKWAGFMGHRYALVTGEPGSRRTSTMSMELDRMLDGDSVDPRIYEQHIIKRDGRKVRKWRRVQ